uniref:Uncharacterized protein n=1 Tax=Tetradesmus obliquus TaxID=3088 RepID=A0A383VV53_TETOB|eukprot:jgi/Sobl393_1/7864/SZX68743.1
MPYKVPQSKVKARMDKEVAAMRAQLTQLQHEHSTLLFQHSLLAALCDSLAWLRNVKQHSSAGCTGQPPPAGAITADEQLLLEQLAGLSCSSIDSQDSSTPAAASRDTLQTVEAPLAGDTATASVAGDAAAAAAAAAALDIESKPSSGDSSGSDGSSSSDSSTTFQLQQQQQQELRLPPGEDTIAPHGDLMQLFRRLLSMRSTSHQHTTLSHLQEDYATVVCELSLNLAMLDQPQHLQAACSAEAPAAAIERLVVRHVHTMVSLLLQQRHDLLQAFYLSNCLSGAVGEEHQKESITAAVQQLRLSKQQVQQISQATAVFKRLLAPLIQGRQVLQGTGFTAASAAVHTGPGVKLEGGGLSSSSSSSSSSGMVLPHAAMLQRLQQQQRRVTNLSTLMKKEMFIKGCLSVFTLGRLTWLQAARLIIHAFPYPASIAAVSQEIAELAQQHVQAQQAAAEAAAAADAFRGSSSGRSGSAGRQGVRRARLKVRR